MVRAERVVQTALYDEKKDWSWVFPLQDMPLGTWNVLWWRSSPSMCLGVDGAEMFQLDIVMLTSMYSLGSGTSILKQGWTHFHSGVGPNESRCGQTY